MTVEEAKAYMENEIRCIQRASYCDRDCAKCNLVKEEKPLLEAYGVAIRSLEEIQSYRAIGTVEQIMNMQFTTESEHDEVLRYRAIGTVSEFRELKEKATAKKPTKIKRHRGGFEMEHCPNCDTDYQVDRRFEVEEDYCGNCGKLLDSSFINFCANCGCPVDMSK